MTGASLTVAEYAKLRGRTPSWVTKSIRSGMPAEGLGRQGSPYRVDPKRAIEWELKRAEQRPHTNSQVDRLLAERADKQALENAAKRCELVRAEDVEATVHKAIKMLDDVLDGAVEQIVAVAAPLNEPGAVRSALLAECRKVRHQYSQRLAGLASSLVPNAEGAGK